MFRISIGARFRNKVYKSRAGIWVPLFDALVPLHQNILAVIQTVEGKFLIPGSNIVTDNGDIHIAQKATGTSPTNVFGIGELCSAGTPAKGAIRSAFTVIGSTQKAHTGGYPKVADADTDNTGAGTDVITYLQSYAKGDFNHAAITHGIITNTGPAAGEPILTGFAFSPGFAKTANDTLKVFQNLTCNGV